MNAVFMVGEQRSGSNLLRLVLNQSPDIAGPHPPHILQRMMPLMRFYGDLKTEEIFMQLVDDVCRLVESNPVTWEGVQFDRNEVRSRCKENSLVAVYGAVMDMYAKANNAQAWICKSMQNIYWADDLNQYFDKPKFVYLYRDPRDVALSFTRAVIGEKHPFFIAEQWTKLQEQCLKQRKVLGADQFFSVCYEDLTAKPESVVRALCEFLDIEFSAEMLSFHASVEASRTAISSSLWENLTRPVMSSNSQKFLREMDPSHIEIVESITGEVMDELGYQRVHVKKGEELQFTDSDIDQFRNENEALKAAKLKETDPEDIRRRRIQEQVVKSIRSTKRVKQKNPILPRTGTY